MAFMRPISCARSPCLRLPQAPVLAESPPIRRPVGSTLPTPPRRSTRLLPYYRTAALYSPDYWRALHRVAFRSTQTSEIKHRSRRGQRTGRDTSGRPSAISEFSSVLSCAAAPPLEVGVSLVRFSHPPALSLAPPLGKSAPPGAGASAAPPGSKAAGNRRVFMMSIFRSVLPRVTRSNGWRCFSTGIPYDTVAELNKEMESIFGESPSPSPLGSSPPQQPGQPAYEADDSQLVLTHTDSSGQAKMVDVSPKEDTKRVAIASCRVLLGQKVFNLVASNEIAKGDALTVAKIAGITGAKQTSNLIPLCHNINLSHVRVDLTLNEEDSSVVIEGEATTSGKTGVEMEAMTAVAIAGLTVYDMCKAASKDICITDVCLQHKSGGKSGSWSRN